MSLVDNYRVLCCQETFITAFSNNVHLHVCKNRTPGPRMTSYKHGLTFYNSLVLPHITYCDVVYATAKQESLNKLQLVQNVACRTILLADKYSNVANMHQNFGLNYLADCRKFHFGNLCHKNIFTDGVRSGLMDYFKQRITEYKNL